MVRVIEEVLEPPAEAEVQVLLVEMQEAYTWEVTEVLEFNPR